MPKPNDMAETIRLSLLVFLVVACFLMGGGSRFDVASLVVLQPLAVLIAAAILVVPGPVRWNAVRVPLLLLGMVVAVYVVQLVPLPPAVWGGLPGHAAFLPRLEQVGLAAMWRPLSLAPDLTAASLAGLSVPAAALVGVAAVGEERAQALLGYLLAGIAVSAILGVGQIATGAGSPLYTYAITNEGAAVGLFANRNHQALLLAMAWPMLAVWGTGTRAGDGPDVVRLGVAAVGAVALIPLLIVTGSRGGIILGAVGLTSALIIVVKRRDVIAHLAPSRWMTPRVMLAAVLASGVALALATILLSRDESFTRLGQTGTTDELRLEFLPLLVRLTADFLPFGTGFGAFDPVFRMFEPDASIAPRYLNHAHNDLIEIVLTGGLPALVPALLLAAWTGWKLWQGKLWRLSSRQQRFAFLGAVMIGLAIIASAADYPLRTPLHQILFAFACAWLAAPRRSSRAFP